MLSLELAGEIVERQTYLNGSRYYLLEGGEAEAGATADGWSWTLAVTLPKEPGDAVSEGDLALQRAETSWSADVVGGSYCEEIDEATDALLTVVRLVLLQRPDDDGAAWPQADAELRIAVETCSLRLTIA